MLCVCQVIPELSAGGAERTTVDVAAGLAARGDRALVASQGGRLADELAAHGGSLIEGPYASKNPVTILRNAGRLTKLAKAENVQVLHARSRAPAWSAREAAKRAGVAFVTTYHGIYNAQSGLKRRYNAIMASGDVVIANSEYTKAHILEEHEIEAERVVVIPRGVDFAVFDPNAIAPERVEAMRAGWGLAPDFDGPVLLLPARLTRWKGHLWAIEALARITQSPAPVLVCAGDPQGREDYVAEVRAAAQTAGLGDQVKVVGHATDMPAAYAASDIVLTPSLEPEAFGRTAVEAQAMGKPVIAADHGAARETVRHNATGVLVRPGDTRALTSALKGLLARGPGGRRTMGRAGRAYTKAHFTVEAMVTATLEVYARVRHETRR
ncbi:MAG: glycosyltransferase family 4 protein [Maricaulaceae bacterium]